MFAGFYTRNPGCVASAVFTEVFPPRLLFGMLTLSRVAISTGVQKVLEVIIVFKIVKIDLCHYKRGILDPILLR